MERQLNFFEDAPPDGGNTKLVDYGILNEKSDFRIHICYLIQHAYVFPTHSGREATIAAMEMMEAKAASSNGRNITAVGYPVPISAIDGITGVIIPPQIHDKNKIYPTDGTSLKGTTALKIAFEMLKLGLIPLPVNPEAGLPLSLEIEGSDIIVNANLRIQVKCDFRGGEKKFGGTGNLYLQTKECNTDRAY